MKEYEVTLSCQDWITIVRAKNKEEAREKGIEDYETSDTKPSVQVIEVEEVK